MNEKESSTGKQVITLGDELLRAMFDDIKKNTEAIKGNNAQIGQLGETIGELAGMKGWMEVLEKEVVSATEVLAAVKEIVDRPGIPVEVVQGLQAGLLAHAAFFERPFKKDIHHRHFLTRPLAVILVMAAAVIVSWVLVGKAMMTAEEYRENDIKWRYAKLIKDSTLLRKLDSAEMKYQKNPDEFRDYVTGEEQRREKLTEMLLEKEVNQEKIDQVKRQEKSY